MIVVIDIFLGVLLSYVIIGFVFGLYFLFLGASQIDPLMKETKKKVRLLLFPGIVVTWPFFIKKILNTKAVSS